MKTIQELSDTLKQQIIGQEKLINRMLITMLCGGHLLVEGPPGIAKTTAIKSLSNSIEADFGRIQFTPDLLPSDLTGAQIYKLQDGSFDFQPGPLFNNFILADEINRAPAKVQSALLEAMAEKQITIASKTYKLPELFLVMATQNPIEQEGTYTLSEAQLDRFLLHIEVGYPDIKAEKQVLKLIRSNQIAQHDRKLSQSTIKQIKDKIANVHMDDAVEDYMLNIIQASRKPEIYDKELSGIFSYGASTRASIALDKTSKAYAYLQNRDFVTPDDIREMAFDVLRHRIILTFAAETKNISKNDAITKLLNCVPAV